MYLLEALLCQKADKIFFPLKRNVSDRHMNNLNYRVAKFLSILFRKNEH